MNTHDKDRFDDILDRALDRIRNEAPEPDAVKRSEERTWEAMSALLEDQDRRAPQAIEIRGCDDYRQLIPAFLAGELNEARALLLKDHSRDCLPCRKALKAARSESAPLTRAATRKQPSGGSRWKTELSWSLAAAVIIGVALIGFAVNTGFFSLETEGMLRVEAVDGALMEVSRASILPLAAGQTLEDGEWIRTAKGSGAKVSLEDGSIVELAERSEMYVSRESGDDTIHLTRGSIIVQASQQGSGHLYVETDDCNVAVTGTVFAVSSGLKGSRVSVIEGAVVVQHGSQVNNLGPGEQVTTSGNLVPIPVSRDIAWSRDAANHLSLLAEMQAFQAELGPRLPDGKLRYATDLLDRVPADTVMYAAIPNLTEHLSQAHQLLEEKINSNPGLAEVWNTQMGGRKTEDLIGVIMDHVEKYGSMIGDEVVLSFQLDGAGGVGEPVVLAKLEDPDRLREELASDLALLESHTGAGALTLIAPPFAAEGGEGLKISIQDDVLVLSPGTAPHRAVAAGNRLQGSPFHGSLAQIYGEGAGIVFGTDLHALMSLGDHDRSVGRVLGFDNIRHLVVNRREIDDRTLTEAALTFSGQRTGMASWLADPGPMGALEFVSPDATAVGGFVVKTPSSLVEELFGMLPTDGRKEFLDRFRDETGLDLLADVVAPLGGEAVIALDGPVLPKPAWKVILEVYDPAGMQRTIETAVDNLNRSGTGTRVELRSSKMKGRTYWAMIPETGPQVHYTFTDGYMLLAPRRVFLDRAIRYRDSGLTLPASDKFADLLPQDGRMNFSAMLYQDLGSILGPLMDGAAGMTQKLAPEHREGLEQMVENLKPSLYVVYGEKDRIIFTGSDHTGLLGTDFGNLFNLGSILSLGEMMEEADRKPAEPVYHGGSGGEV